MFHVVAPEEDRYSTGHTQKNGATLEVDNIFFPPYTGTIYNVSSGNSRSFSCAISSSLLMLTAGPRDQSPRWRRSKGRFCMCSVLRCPDLWLQCSVSSQHDLKNTLFLCGSSFFKPCMNLTRHCNHRHGNIKTEHTESLLLLWRHLGNWSRGPAVSIRRKLLVAHERLEQFPLLTVYVVPV
jgi:hypothetical protein